MFSKVEWIIIVYECTNVPTVHDFGPLGLGQQHHGSLSITVSKMKLFYKYTPIV